MTRSIATTLICALGVATLAFAAPAQASKTPRQVIETTVQAVQEGMQARRSEFQTDEEQLQEFIRGTLGAALDERYSARMVLGRHGRGANDTEVAAFAEALSENLLRRYGRALLELDSNVVVRVTEERPLRDGQIVRVGTEVRRPNGAPIPIQYLFRNHQGNWKVFDVIVEGISYVQTFRNQFDEPLRSRGIARVTEDLRAGRLQVEDVE